MGLHNFTTGIRGPSTVVVDDEFLNSEHVDMEAGRRAFAKSVGLALLGAAVFGTTTMTTEPADAQAIDDTAIANFALNTEYLGAEFYLHATAGRSLSDDLTTGTGTRGDVRGGHQTQFTSAVIRNYANEFAGDEIGHVAFLRATLGSAAVARPAINLFESFTIAARAAGFINNQQTFDPFADDNGFLVGAFIFEDVDVTAYVGAAPLITSKSILASAASILATEAYHAGTLRSTLYARGLYDYAQGISNVRNTNDGPADLDQGIGDVNTANVVPTGGNGLPASRTTSQVLGILYGNPSAQPGLFFPNGLNGTIR